MCPSGSPLSLGEGRGKQKGCPGAPLGHTPSTCQARSYAGLGLGYARNLWGTYKGFALQIPKRFLTSPVQLPYLLLAAFGLHWGCVVNIE